MCVCIRIYVGNKYIVQHIALLIDLVFLVHRKIFENV